MATKTLTSSRRRAQQDEVRKKSDEGTDCDSGSGAPEGGAATPLVRPRKPKFTTPFKQPGPEPDENGSACSSPSVSGFIIAPSQKPRGEKKEKKTAPSPSASKVFSGDDVISLLKGLAVFWANGKNNKWAEFHLFVKDDLGNQFTKTQVSEKIRNLKKKFENNSVRAQVNGGRIDLSDPHESAVFELSKALWGDEKGIAREKVEMGGNGDEEVNEIRTEMEEVVENDEGSKKKKKKKRKQLGEHSEENKKMKKGEHEVKELLEEGDVRDAADTILSIRNLLDEHGEGSKKARKKKRKQGDERHEKEELVMERMQVDGHDEGNKISSKEKQVDEGGERSKKKKKTKLVDECGEANENAGEQNEVDEPAAKREILKEVDEPAAKREILKEVDVPAAKREILKEVTQVDQHDEKDEELLKEGEQVDEHEQREKPSKKQKKVDVEKDLANQGKQVDDHREENSIPSNRKQEKEIAVDDFQSAYPLLYASFDIFGYSKVAMEKCVLMGRENAQELEEKWRELNAEMHRLELKKLDLMKRQGK